MASDLEETFRVSKTSDAVWCRQKATLFARTIGFQGESLSQIAIAVSELTTNAAKFAAEARVTLRRLDDPRRGIEVVVDDDGPGIADPEMAIQDGYSEGRFLANDDLIGTRRGMGAGLGAVKRMMSTLEIDNKKTGGLRVTARKWLSERER